MPRSCSRTRFAPLPWQPWFACRQRIGFDRLRTRIIVDRRTPATSRFGYVSGKPFPVLDDYNRLVAPLSVPDPGHRMELFTTPADDAATSQVWNDLGLNRFSEVIGLNSSGAFGAAKLSPAEHFANLSHARRSPWMMCSRCLRPE